MPIKLRSSRVAVYRSPLVFVIGCIVASAGCDDEGGSGLLDASVIDAAGPGDTPPNDAGKDATANVEDAARDSGIDGSQPDHFASEAGSGPCLGEGTIELIPTVEGGPAPATAGRLVVAWYQFNDDPPSPAPKVAYDVPFDPAAARITVPLQAVSPPEADHVLCPRACKDENKCPCLSEPKVTYSFVGVFRDADSSGAIEPEEFASDNLLGVAHTALVCSESAYAADNEMTSYLFPEGTRAGLHPYRPFKADPDSSFDRLGLPSSRTFELFVCSASTPNCDLPVPNLN